MKNDMPSVPVAPVIPYGSHMVVRVTWWFHEGKMQRLVGELLGWHLWKGISISCLAFTVLQYVSLKLTQFLT
jgi:hypothetical protein